LKVCVKSLAKAHYQADMNLPLREEDQAEGNLRDQRNSEVRVDWVAPKEELNFGEEQGD
jgi:hypothetical protein